VIEPWLVGGGEVWNGLSDGLAECGRRRWFDSFALRGGIPVYS
jgi:hypothetical protein